MTVVESWQGLAWLAGDCFVIGLFAQAGWTIMGRVLRRFP
jgi:hypothetical protein